MMISQTIVAPPASLETLTTVHTKQNRGNFSAPQNPHRAIMRSIAKTLGAKSAIGAS
jgi:hypothetical protein